MDTKLGLTNLNYHLTANIALTLVTSLKRYISILFNNKEKDNSYSNLKNILKVSIAYINFAILKKDSLKGRK